MAIFTDAYLAYLLARASHLISDEFHAVVRRARLPVLQWRVLAALAEGHALSVGELATIVLTPQSTLTRVAERMVRSGLLLRAADSADRRITRVHLSAAGRKLAGELVAQARVHESAVLARLDADDALALKRILRLIIDQHAAGVPAGAARPAR
jgi:DNA-binding MarR family transcriptional regulator